MTETTTAAEVVNKQEESKEPRIIPAQNPSAEEMQSLVSTIKANYNFKVDVKPTIFRFKKQKDKDTGLESVRQALELAIPVPSLEGIVEILETGGKQLELLMEAVESVVMQTARDMISEDEKLNASNFPLDKLSWEAIANMPKAARKGGGIPKEVWEAFGKDYIETMPGVTGKSVEQVSNAARLFVGKLSAVKTNKPALELLVGQLAIYAEHSSNAEDYQECIEFLLQKADSYLNLTPEQLLQNL